MKNRKSAFLILSASVMMMYNLSCATAGLSLASAQNNNDEAVSVADESYESIPVDPAAPEIKIISKKIIVHPVTRKVASEE